MARAYGRRTPQVRGGRTARRRFRMNNKPRRRAPGVLRGRLHSRSTLFSRRNSPARRAEARARRRNAKPWHRRR